MDTLSICRQRPEDALRAAEAIKRLKPEARDHGLTDASVCRVFLAHSNNVLVVAHDQDLPAGYAIAHILTRVDRPEPTLLLYEVEVAENHRQCGIGRSMIEQIKAIGASVGAYKMWTLTDRSNAAARALYGAAGAEERGENLLYVWSEDDLHAS